MPSLGNIDLNGSTAGQNLNSNTFFTEMGEDQIALVTENESLEYGRL